MLTQVHTDGAIVGEGGQVVRWQAGSHGDDVARWRDVAGGIKGLYLHGGTAGKHCWVGRPVGQSEHTHQCRPHMATDDHSRYMRLCSSSASARAATPDLNRVRTAIRVPYTVSFSKQLTSLFVPSLPAAATNSAPAWPSASICAAVMLE